MAVDISDLPSPSKVDISDLPSPKKEAAVPEKESGFYKGAKAFGKSALEALPSAGGALAGAEGGALLGSALGPVGTVVGGLGGAIAGGYLGEKGGQAVGGAIPTGFREDIGFGEEQRRKEKRQNPLASALGTITPDVAAISPSLYKAGKAGINLLRSPEPLAPIKDLAEVGEKGFKFLKDKASKMFEARSLEAEQKYDAAFNAARQQQAQGNPFGLSPQGQNLLAKLEQDKRIIAGGKEFEKGGEKIAGIDRLINAIKGTTTGGQTVPVGKGIVTSTLTKKTPTKTTEKDIEAVVEELRFLRDVDAKGKPYEAYAGLSADYKRDLKKSLEEALHNWSDEYRVADEAYKKASANLAPFKTQLMSGALKGEKFNPADLVKSPEDFGPIFFSDVNGVRNLKEATGDPAEVARLGKEYMAALLSNKTPKQVQEIVGDPKNIGWLKEAKIYNDVQNYANKANKVANRQEILNLLKKGTFIGIGGAIGLGGAKYPISRAFGG